MLQQDDQTLAQKPPASEQRELQPKNGNGEEESIESLPLYRNFKVVIPVFIVLFGLAFVTWQYYINARDFITTDDAYIDGNRVSISAKILGRIDQLQVDEGDPGGLQQGAPGVDGREILGALAGHQHGAPADADIGAWPERCQAILPEADAGGIGLHSAALQKHHGEVAHPLQILLCRRLPIPVNSLDVA